jgi:hypothetical protein
MKPKDIRATVEGAIADLTSGEEDELHPSGLFMSWRGEGWGNFSWVTSEIAERESLSLGVAERTLRELCATGDVRSIRYYAMPDEEREPETIRPSEWVKDQVDLVADIWTWIFVSADDVQYWLDDLAKAAGRPVKKLSLRDEPTEPTSPTSATARTARKVGLARTAIRDLWPELVPEALTNPQIEKQVDDWITAYCKKNNQPKPEIGRDTILRAAGRRQ